MKVRIKLDNSEYCDDCPLLRYPSVRRGCYCEIGYHKAGAVPQFVERPEKCIKENGE